MLWQVNSHEENERDLNGQLPPEEASHEDCIKKKPFFEGKSLQERLESTLKVFAFDLGPSKTVPYFL